MSFVFPRTNVEKLSFSIMIIGTNRMADYSHTGPAVDNMIKEHHSDTTCLFPMLCTFLENGVVTMMSPFVGLPVIYRAVQNQTVSGKN